MQVEYWGPKLWAALHTITFDYPENPSPQDMKNYRDFFHSLKNVLPCSYCREHYKKNIEQDMPIEKALTNRTSLSKWLVDLHNNVNQRLGKPTATYDAIKEKYDSIRGVCLNKNGNSQNTCAKSCYKNTTTDILLYLVVILLFIVVCLAIYYIVNLHVKK